eukprot:6212137-Pleurochrysis_carterae.AAC.1
MTDHEYHESQVRMRCAQHALNNLLGSSVFDSSTLDGLAIKCGGYYSLAHRWPFVGNYDANVVLLALDQQGFEVKWHDGRNSVGSLMLDCSSVSVVGLLLNMRSDIYGLLPFGRHWVACRRVCQQAETWIEHDSRVAGSVRYEAAAFLSRLKQLTEKGAVILVISKKSDPTSLGLLGTHNSGDAICSARLEAAFARPCCPVRATQCAGGECACVLQMDV